MGHIIESLFWITIQSLVDGLSNELTIAMPGLYVCQDISRLKQEQARTSGDYCAFNLFF